MTERPAEPGKSVCRSQAFDLQYQPTREVRFAVTMLGGPSLAIYSSGVSQELLNLVRATAPAQPHDDACSSQSPLLGSKDLRSTQLVYRKLGQMVSHGSRPRASEEVREDDPILTRFIVDIISGSSVCGVNAIFLAKALTTNRDMGCLERLWKEDTDIGSLLNDQGPQGSPRPREPRASLLDGRRFHSTLYRGLEQMDTESSGGQSLTGPSPLVDDLDLFITVTDLEGLCAPITVTDRVLQERIHRMTLHFEYRPSRAVQFALLPSGSVRRRPVNDFKRANNGVLAFACRATASFPIAFEPVTLDDVKTVLPGLSESELRKPPWSKFFPSHAEADTKQTHYSRRQLADGGYLENRAFRNALDAIRYRDSWGPVDRKLIFLDPFPERTEDSGPTRGPFNFVESAFRAAVSLPIHQALREDLEALNRQNQQIAMLKRLRSRLLEETEPPRWRRIRGRDFGNTPFSTFLEERGASYVTYLNLRVFSVTDSIASLLTRMVGFPGNSDLSQALSYLVRAWRVQNYVPNPSPDGNRRLETQFLLQFDIDCRLRRLDGLRFEIDQRLLASQVEPDSESHEAPFRRQNDPGIPELRRIRRSVRQALLGLHQTYSQLWGPCRETSAPEALRLQGLTAHLVSISQLEGILSVQGEDARVSRAKEVLRSIGEERIQVIAGFLEKTLHAAFSEARESVEAALPESSNQEPSRSLRNLYDLFDYHDSLLFPLLSTMDAGEADAVEIYRIGPADAVHTRSALDPEDRCRPAGSALFDFGAVLRREWRDNDLMRGRLDGAERIICSILPEDTPDRRELINKAHRMILDETLRQVSPPRNALDSEQRICLFRQTSSAPRKAPEDRALHWTQRVLGIFADMLRSLHAGRGPVTHSGSLLVTLVSVFGTLVSLALPDSPISRYRNTLLATLTASCGLVLVSGIAMPPGLQVAVWSCLLLTAILFLANLLIKRCTDTGLRSHWLQALLVGLSLPALLSVPGVTLILLDQLAPAPGEGSRLSMVGLVIVGVTALLFVPVLVLKLRARR